MSKRQKRVMFYSSPLIVLVIIAFAKLKLDQIEANAQRLAQVGQDAQKLLGEFRTGVEKFDVQKVLSCYDDRYASDREVFSTEQLESERDGVRVYKWRPAAEKAIAKQDVSEEIERYLK